MCWVGSIVPESFAGIGTIVPVSLKLQAEPGCDQVAERGVRGKSGRSLYCIDLVRQDAVTIQCEQTKPNKRQMPGEQLGSGIQRGQWR